MNFKVIKYQCNHSYIFITSIEKRILKDHRLCPICKAPKKHVTVYCMDCGLRMVVNGRAWERLKRCRECSRLKNLQRSKKCATEKKQPKRKPQKSINHFAEIAKKTGALRRLYRKMSIKLPEYPDTPILDKFISGIA